MFVKNRFPWRWTALECLTTDASNPLKFSTRTDVWSYGVTCWEILNFCAVPFADWDSDIVRGLMSGVRLAKPKTCSQQM